MFQILVHIRYPKSERIWFQKWVPTVCAYWISNMKAILGAKNWNGFGSKFWNRICSKFGYIFGAKNWNQIRSDNEHRMRTQIWNIFGSRIWNQIRSNFWHLILRIWLQNLVPRIRASGGGGWRTPRSALGTVGRWRCFAVSQVGGNGGCSRCPTCMGEEGQRVAGAWHICGTYGGTEREDQSLCDVCVVTRVSIASHNFGANC